MVESVKIYSYPQDAHTRFAHDAQLSEGAFSRDVAASSFVSSATTMMDRGPKFTAFDTLFTLTPKSLVYSEAPTSFFTQLRSTISAQSEYLFGSIKNLDSNVEVIRNVVEKDRKEKEGGKQQQQDQEDTDSNKLTDVMQQLKILYRDRSFVYSKIGSLIQG